MPIASPSELISTARAREHLRVASDYGAAEIDSLVRAAVGWVETRAGTPILDTPFRVFAAQGRTAADSAVFRYVDGVQPLFTAYGRTQGIVVPQRGVRGGLTISYWEPAQERREAPSGAVSGSAYRIEAGEFERHQGLPGLMNNPVLYPLAADGWPESAEGAPFIIEGSAGFNEAADVPEEFTAAALMIVSGLFENPDAYPKFERTAESLLHSWVRVGG